MVITILLLVVVIHSYVNQVNYHNKENPHPFILDFYFIQTLILILMEKVGNTYFISH